MSEPLQPQQEVEVQGLVGEALVLPFDNDGVGPYVWTLELPDEVAQASEAANGRLRVRVERPGSYVLVATLADPGSEPPMTVLPIRLTVA